MNNSFDIVIVGSGIGGLSTILYLSETDLYKKGNLSICLISKGALNETNTNWAQGGIAAVKAIDDNFDIHINDTLNAGAFVNNKFIVKKVVHSGPAIMNDLVRWGATFDKKDNLDFDLALEGGHSAARIWHKEDQTGKEIQDTLIHSIKNLKGLKILEYYSVIDAIKTNDQNFRLTILDNKLNNFSHIHCANLVLATGGVGMLFEKSTNQKIATGDGIYLANRLGALIENLSLIQFHPTGLYEKGQICFLISEAMRGAGAILRNEKGEAFMHKYDNRLNLAPRDIVSRAIESEIREQSLPYVYLDCTSINTQVLNTHFPAIKQACLLRVGINIENELIPVVPVEHYSCGGVKVDEYGQTNINGLFAIGEVASTGLHGANRLASNSLLEAIAFAKFASPVIVQKTYQANILESNITPPVVKKIDRSLIQHLMSKYASIVKTNEGLKTALEQLIQLKDTAITNSNFSVEEFEANCILDVAILLIQDARNQKLNKGVFFNSDLVS